MFINPPRLADFKQVLTKAGFQVSCISRSLCVYIYTYIYYIHNLILLGGFFFVLWKILTVNLKKLLHIFFNGASPPPTHYFRQSFLVVS